MSFSFPKIAAEAVPYYKHPHALFTLTPLTLVSWRSVQILSHEEIFGSRDAKNLAAANVCLCLLAIFHNLGCAGLAGCYNHYFTRLNRAVVVTFCLQMANYFDAVVPDELDYRLGDDALYARVAFVAFSVLCSFYLIHYANKDEPYSIMLEMREGRIENNENDEERALV